MEPVRRHIIESELTELMTSAWECAQDLQSELETRYPSRDTQPVEQRRFDRDMEPVRRLFAAYEKLEF